MIIADVIDFRADITEVRGATRLACLNLDEVDVVELNGMPVVVACVGETEVVHLSGRSIDEVAAEIINISPIVGRYVGVAIGIGAAVGKT